MTTPAEIYPHVLAAVRLVMQDKKDYTATPDAVLAHNALWPYVTHAVEEIANPSAPVPDAPKPDRRSKSWRVVVKFYTLRPEVPGADADGKWLIAETDPEIVQGTGSLPELIEKYAEEMCPDEALFPSPLVAAKLRERIPQLRNNLGRQGSATLRIEYIYEGAAYLCEVSVSAA